MEQQTFGQRLKNYRKAKNLTQQELGEKIGVSDKTVSRWESDGGYPDVPTLVPLAQALGVTVDDLLNTRRPVRTLTRTDWQNFLSFAFALGGGVLFFLLELFVPVWLCYLAYLGCLAYGVYLQKYYAYQSRWFLLGEAVVNLGVNLSLAVKWMFMLTFLGMGMLAFLSGALALTATGVTQYLVWKKGFGEGVPLEMAGGGGGSAGHALVKRKLCWRSPSLRKLLPALIPLLAGCFWLPGIWRRVAEASLRTVEGQKTWFLWWLLLLGILAAIPLLKRGYRRWIIPAWLMTIACHGMLGLRVYPLMWSQATQRFIPGNISARGDYILVGWGSWGTLAFALFLAAAWLVLCGLRWEVKETEGNKMSPYGA